MNYTANEIAAALGMKRQAVRWHLRGMTPAGVKVVRGNEADAWEFCQLPAVLQKWLQAEARKQNCRDAEALLTRPRKQWLPPLALDKICEADIQAATKLREALRPWLLRQHELTPAELKANALPEASQSVFRVLATYARTSARYLAAIESIAQRARYLAARAGRQQCTTEDVRTAMKESVIPSDTRLNSAIETTRAQSSRRRLPAVPLAGPAELMETSPSPARHRLPEPVQDAPAPRRANLAEFATA